MPSKAKKVDRDVAKLASIPKEWVNHFLTGPMTVEAVNAAGLVFKTALIDASLNAELGHHLGYAAGEEKPERVSNHRNASTSKTVLTGDGKSASRRRATARAVSNRCCFPSIHVVSPASTTASWRCMRAA